MYTLQDNLRTHGYKVTAARSVVFKALSGQEPLTMREVLTRADTIDRASVYRTIDLFQQLGIVQRLQTGWKYKLELTDAFHEHHHHATCRNCGNTIALAENNQLEALIHLIAESHGFSVEKHQLELEGLCQNCRNS